MIVYLHGFASTGQSTKVVDLRIRFGGENVVAPDLPFDPHEVLKVVNNIVTTFYKNRQPNEKLVFVGTSLGAFYANFFGHVYDCPAVLVNPSANPSKSLMDKLGPNINYMSGEEFMVSMAHLDKLDMMRKHVQENYSGSLVHLFAAKDDEVIPYEAMLENFKYTSHLCVMEDGGHRFTKHWGLVVDHIEKILNDS